MPYFHRRIRPILQEEPTECGLACVVMVANHFGHRVSLSLLRDKFPTSVRGSSALDLIDVADTLGLKGRGVKVAVANLKGLRLPIILHWRLNHFVVLQRIRSDRFQILDPAIGQREIDSDEFGRCFTGICIEFHNYNNINSELFERKQETILSTLWHDSVNRQWIIRIAIASFFLEFGLIALPLIQQITIDRLFIKEQDDLLFFICVAISLTFLYRFALTAIRQILLRGMQSEAMLHISSIFADRILRMPIRFVERRHASDIIYRLNYARLAFTAVIALFAESGFSTIFGLFSLFIMFIYSFEISVFLLLSMLVYSGYRWFNTIKMQNLTAQRQQHYSDAHEVFSETIKALSHVRMSGIERSRYYKYTHILSVAISKDIGLLRYHMGFNLADILREGIDFMIIIYFGWSLVNSDLMTVGMFVAYYNFYRHFNESFSMLIENISDYVVRNVDYTRFSEIMHAAEDSPPKKPDHKLPIGDLSNKVSLSKVSFAFPGERRDLIHRLDLRISAGEKVAILGKSGCGKSTLLRLISGIEIPHDGRVEIGGFTVNDLGHNTYRQLVSWVQQDEYLFTGSILDNIVNFEEQFDMERLSWCCEMVDLQQEIETMPMGLNTMIWGGGKTYSGGQIQRIVLARALYQQRPVLLLDEATAHLDEASEGAILDRLVKLDTTLIVVTHRSQSVINRCRCIHFERSAGGVLQCQSRRLGK
ncbi:MAG: peptidase domain-containing ABC transporter [Alphaproteobacteria bacterium GM202ARS2]|nr:peptidase domain-containing ABC transporter [Alphaproteobacteria bacterium GM202ARS2]